LVVGAFHYLCVWWFSLYIWNGNYLVNKNVHTLAAVQLGNLKWAMQEYNQRNQSMCWGLSSAQNLNGKTMWLVQLKKQTDPSTPLGWSVNS
jgi:hypothetical protein